MPDSLRALLAYIGEEYLDEAVAQVGRRRRLAGRAPRRRAEGEVVLGKPNRRFSGTTTFTWRGRPMTVVVVPYRIFLIKRLQDAGGRRPIRTQRATIRSVLAEAGLDPLLDIRPRRWVLRADNREVWGPLQEPAIPS